MSDSVEDMTKQLLDMQYTLIDTKIDAITKTLANLGSDVRKVLDDHELRLREKTKNDAATAQQLSTFQMEHRDLKNELTLLKLSIDKKFEDYEKEKDERTKREMSLWQTVAFELLKMVAFGASGGGTIIGLIKLFGINL